MQIAQKSRYLMSSIWKHIIYKGFYCPSCGNKKSQVIDRKYYFTTLRRCSSCQLLYRAPVITAEEYNHFYQKEYTSGFSTTMPSREYLNCLLKTAFKGTEKDYSVYISLLDAIGGMKGDKLLDYGCSWGYGSWQLKNAGYTVSAFELSKPRCDYARKYLGINAFSSLKELAGPFDIFFSAHVLEHVSSVSQTIAVAWELLRPGGVFVAFTPNGGGEYRRTNPLGWHKLWGFVHPNALDDRYYKETFKNYSKILASTPYRLNRKDELSSNCTKLNDLSGGELMVAVRKPE